MTRPDRPASLDRIALTIVVALLALAAAFPSVASTSGYTGRTATTSGGCGSCHSSSLGGTTTAVLSGPASLAPGATGSYTCVVTHTPAFTGTNRAGVNVAVKTAPNGSTNAGALTASGAGLKVSGGELTHSAPTSMSGSPSTTTYAFTWTAPSTAGTYTMQAIGLATNGSKPGVWGWATPLSIVVAAADPVPVADFSFSPASPVVGAAVSFTDASTGSATSWAWSFGDGGTSTAQSPTHVFATAGTWTVTLTTANGSGSSSKSKTVTVTAPAPSWVAAWLLPSSARAGGANAFWTTDLVVTNSGTQPAEVNLKFLGHDGTGASGPERTYTIPARATRTFADVLSGVFGLESDWGPILVRSSVATLAVQGTTWTPSPAGGTYGQSVPALGAVETVGTTSKAIAGVRQDAAFRTNLVLANTKETAATVLVELLLADGTTSTTRSVELGPYGFLQLNVGSDLGVTDISGGSFLLSSTTANAAVAAYASVIDATTSDPRSVLAR